MKRNNEVWERRMLAFKAPSSKHEANPEKKEEMKFPDYEFYLDETIPENIDAVLLAGCDFEEIFKTTKAASPIWVKRLPVVKISFKGKSIYRRFYGHKELGEKGRDGKYVGVYAALNYSSLYELVDDKIDSIKGEMVQISKGRRFPYYWNHPFHATRISARLGFISIAIAIISLVLSIFCNLPLCQ